MTEGFLAVVDRLAGRARDPRRVRWLARDLLLGRRRTMP